MADNFKSSPFEVLSSDVQARIGDLLERRTFRKGETIFELGQPTGGLAWQRQGIMLIYTEHGANYGMAWPAYRGIWGAPSSFSGAHAATFRAATPCSFDHLPATSLNDLLQDPEVARLVGAFAARDLAISLEVASLLNDSRADMKLRRFLLSVGRHAASGADAFTGGAMTVPWPFSKAELAHMLRLSRPHVSILFSRIEDYFPAQVVDGKLHIAPDVHGTHWLPSEQGVS